MDNRPDEFGGLATGVEDVGVRGGGISLRSLTTFSSFKNPVYRLFYASMLGHWASMNMQIVTRSLLIYRITGSGAILGLMSLAAAIPMLFLSFYGGAIADRVQKKYVLLSGQLASAAISLGVAVALTVGYLNPQHPGSWWVLMISAILQGTVMGIMMPSRQAIIPEIVEEAQVMNAISLNNLGMNTFRLTAPALAGLLIDTFDFNAIYFTATGVYIIATVCVVFLPKTRSMPTLSSSALADVIEGVKYVRQEKIILIILLFTLSGMVCAQPFMFLIPMFTEDILKVGATGMGLLLSVSGFGALIGSLALASLPNRKRGSMMILSGMVMGLALLGFSYSHWWYPSLITAAFIGLGQTGHMTMGNTLAMYYAAPNYRGRVMSFYMMGMGFASLGTFFAGVLAEVVGVQYSIGSLALVLLLISVFMATIPSRFRSLE